MDEIHKELMALAIRISEENMNSGGGPFGAVIAFDGSIVATGANRVTTENDPTAHAEVSAIREACRKLGTHDLSGHVIYTSCEPCPMCLAAIYWANITTVYYANNRKDAADAGFRDDLFYEEIKTENRDRKIPAKELMREEAVKVFEKWKNLKDKKIY